MVELRQAELAITRSCLRRNFGIGNQPYSLQLSSLSCCRSRPNEPTRLTQDGASLFMKIILDEDYARLQAVKARLHAVRLTESDEHNFRRLTASIADVARC